MDTIKENLAAFSKGRHHSCFFYSSPEDQMRVTIPFLALGLEENERSVFLGNPEAVRMVSEGLVNVGVNVDQETRNKRLILSSERDYLVSNRFDTEKMIEFINKTYDATISEGYAALRGTGDASWEMGPNENYKEFLYYESILDGFLSKKQLVAMCQYPREKCHPDLIKEILNTHKSAVIDQEVYPAHLRFLPLLLFLEKE